MLFKITKLQIERNKKSMTPEEFNSYATTMQEKIEILYVGNRFTSDEYQNLTTLLAPSEV